MTNTTNTAKTFEIGAKVCTVRGKKVYTIVSVDEFGNYKMAEGGKFVAGYLRPAKGHTLTATVALPVAVQVVEFFHECEKIVWEPK